MTIGDTIDPMPGSQPLPQALAPFVAPVAALLGVAVGKFWESQSDRKKWVRDQRLDSYSKAVSASIRFLFALREAWAAQTGEEAVVASDRVYEVLDEVQHDSAALMLFGPDEVLSAMQGMVDAFIRAQDVVLDHKEIAARHSVGLIYIQHFDEYWPAKEAFENFVAAARKALPSKWDASEP